MVNRQRIIEMRDAAAKKLEELEMRYAATRNYLSGQLATLDEIIKADIEEEAGNQGE